MTTATTTGAGDSDGDGLFDPTKFHPGTFPGISARELNRMGEAIRDAQIAARNAGTAARVGGRTTTLLTMGV